MDVNAHDALSGFLRDQVRVELSGDFDRIAAELDEVRLRLCALEAQAGIPHPRKGTLLDSARSRVCAGRATRWSGSRPPWGSLCPPSGKTYAPRTRTTPTASRLGHGETTSSDPRRP